LRDEPCEPHNFGDFVRIINGGGTLRRSQYGVLF
jgi:hypothetical protein